MSSEEQTCLVRARSDSESSGRNLSGFGSIIRNSGMAYSENLSGSETTQNNGTAASVVLQEAVVAPNGDLGDSAELTQYQDMNILSQFHEDAIRQAGFGRHQLMMGCVLGFALAASGIEYSVIPYVIPSAEVEFCMTSRQKWWLGSITLVGIACGSIVWGNLSDSMGRRRTLLSCLGVNAVFSVIAAFMPTPGPFMMARFCSGIGVGGVPVCGVGLLCELASGRRRRCCSIAPLLSCVALGGLTVAGGARALLPATGPDTLIENREHFSAWHRYLLLCSLPTIFALAGLVWAHESPRYLLECSREVEALTIYQRMYKKNRSAGAATGGGYQLSELELPPKRQAPSRNQAPNTSVLADMAYSIHQFWNSFVQLFSAPFGRTTGVLSVTMCCVLFCQIGLTIYAPGLIIRNKNAAFEANTTRIMNATYNNELFNESSIENRIIENSTFVNCTFKDITFSHVMFRFCTFINVEFSNIMSSFTFFEGSYFQDTRFIDTDLNTARHMDSGCSLINSTILGLSPVCPLEADHNIYILEVIRTHAACAGGACIAALLCIFLPTLNTTVISLVLAALSSPGIYFLSSETSIIAYSSVFIGLMMLAYVGLVIIIMESYPVHLRCTAYGFIFSLSNMSALIAAGIYSNMTLYSYVLASLMTAIVATTGESEVGGCDLSQLAYMAASLCGPPILFALTLGGCDLSQLAYMAASLCGPPILFALTRVPMQIHELLNIEMRFHYSC